MKIAYLGPEGSYSQLAAMEFIKNSAIPAFGVNECVPFRNATEVFAAVQAGRVDGAAIPIENSLQGGVLQNLDLLQASEDLYAVAERVLKIDHRLVYKEGVEFSEIGRVYSHRQALGQCSNFFAQRMPFAALKETESTAFGLVKATDDLSGKSAAVVGSHTKHIRTGFVMSEECISDEKNNFTHFLLLKKGKDALPEQTDRIFFSTVCLHRPGSLMELLSVIKKYEVNMTKIESRPVKDRPGEYRFFIEADCNLANSSVKEMLEQIQKSTLECKLLGGYCHG